MSIDEPLARKLVSAMLGEEESEVDDDMLDGVGEVSNMIAGTSKTTLADTEHHFDLSIPIVLVGEKQVVTPHAVARGVQINCRCEGRGFVIASGPRGSRTHFRNKSRKFVSSSVFSSSRRSRR